MEARARRKVLPVLLAAIGLPVAAFFLTAAGGDPPLLPGVAAKADAAKNCLSCHVNAGPGQDSRLNVVLARNPKHPKIDKVVKVVPKDCAICHKEGAKAGELSVITHRNHYGEVPPGSFGAEKRGACLSCHDPNPASGATLVKNEAKNW